MKFPIIDLSELALLVNQDKVDEFQLAMGQPVRATPHLPGPEERELRKRLMREEMAEYLEAEDANDLENIAKELADILYIAYGTAATYGFNLDDVFDLVHASNMSKLGADGKPIVREDGKILKGPNYQAPDIAGYLALDEIKGEVA